MFNVAGVTTWQFLFDTLSYRDKGECGAFLCLLSCKFDIVPPYPHVVVSARRLIYLVVLYKRRTIRRELPLDASEFFRARDRAREFRLRVVAFTELLRMRRC